MSNIFNLRKILKEKAQRPIFTRSNSEYSMSMHQRELDEEQDIEQIMNSSEVFRDEVSIVMNIEPVEIKTIDKKEK